LALTLILLVACGGGDSTPPVTPPSSTSLSYPSGTQTLVIGTAITPITPTITGTVSDFSVQPNLPAGLTLDSSKGTISGTPTAVAAAASYTISAGGAISATISIAVNDVPPKVSYGAASITFSANIASTTVTPTVTGGAVTSWSISPALPVGLSFDAHHGSISGTPTMAAAAMSYVVVAGNSGGQSTVTLKIAVDAGAVVRLGHQSAVTTVRATASRVLSFDSATSNWILWDYAGTTIVASGTSGCADSPGSPICLPSPRVDLAGSTAVIVIPTGLEVHSSTDGRATGTITTPVGTRWWKLATDGSYIAAGSSAGLSAWSPAGQLLFTRPGDYSVAVAFAASGNILVAAGAAGASVVETIDVPSGTATTSTQQFNGTFGSWFPDGTRFETTAATTVLVYSSAVSQVGSIAQVPAGATVGGYGNWIWTYPNPTNQLNVYPASAASTTPTFTATLSAQATPYPSGPTVSLMSWSGSAFSVVDLSGSTPTKTDYNASALQTAAGSGPPTTPYAAVSAAQWVLGSTTGVVVDGASLAGTPRYFGLGVVASIAAGSGHFAIATPSTIYYYNSATLALEGHIAFAASKVELSADGRVLVAQGSGYGRTNNYNVVVYDLPAGNLVYAWPYTASTFPDAIALSGSGTVLGQVIFNGSASFTLQTSAPAGGSLSLSATFSSTSFNLPVLLSPDGTEVATSPNSSPDGRTLPGTDLYANGVLVTAVNGFPAAWLDNDRLLVNAYANTSIGVLPNYTYIGCILYSPDGKPTGAACALPMALLGLQSVTTDAVYAPQKNQILSVSTGAGSWLSGDPTLNYPFGAIAGGNVVFISNIDLLAQPF